MSQYEMIHLMNFEVERTCKLRGEYFLCKASSTLHGFLKSAPAFLGDSSHKQVWLGEVPEEALRGPPGPGSEDDLVGVPLPRSLVLRPSAVTLWQVSDKEEGGHIWGINVSASGVSAFSVR